MFGAGTVQPAEGQFMVIDFNGTLKKFSYTASMNSGYLSAEDPAVEARLQAYQDYNKEKDLSLIHICRSWGGGSAYGC